MPKDNRSKITRKAKAAAAPVYTASQLREAGEETVQNHRRAPTTRKAYNSQVLAARKFLIEFVEREVESWDGEHTDSSAPDLAEKTSASTSDESLDDQPWLDPDFLKAFDDAPNKHSPEALYMYLAERCVAEELSKSTADSVCAAFRDLWEET